MKKLFLTFISLLGLMPFAGIAMQHQVPALRLLAAQKAMKDNLKAITNPVIPAELEDYLLETKVHCKRLEDKRYAEILQNLSQQKTAPVSFIQDISAITPEVENNAKLLINTIESGNSSFADLLLKCKANPQDFEEILKKIFESKSCDPKKPWIRILSAVHPNQKIEKFNPLINALDNQCDWQELDILLYHITDIHKQKMLNDALAHSVKINANLDSIKYLLKQGADSASANYSSCTPRTKILLQAYDPLKNFINQQDTDGNTPLMLEKDSYFFEELLKNGANPCIQNNQGKNALHVIIKNLCSRWSDYTSAKGERYLKLLILLLSNSRVGEFINMPDNDYHYLTHKHAPLRTDTHYTPLLCALDSSCSYLVIDQLIRSGANIHKKTTLGSSVIHLCGANAYCTHEDETKKIIDAIVALDKKTVTNQLPLIDQTDNDGNSPLMRAASADHGCEIRVVIHGLMDALLSHNPNIYTTNKHGKNVLNLLLESHTNWLGFADIGYWNSNIPYEKKEARWIKEREDILKQILASDSRHLLVNNADENGDISLMSVQAPPMVTYSDIGTHQLGARLAETIRDGNLKPAQSILEIIKILIANGANVGAKNNRGETFINFLVKSKEKWLYPVLKEIIELIPKEEIAQILNEPDNDGNSPVINAIGKKWYKPPHSNSPYYNPLIQDCYALKILLECGADVNTKNKENKSALEIAYDYEKTAHFTEQGEFTKIILNYKQAQYETHYPYANLCKAINSINLPGSWVAASLLSHLTQKPPVEKK